jgi:hypothetical protein
MPPTESVERVVRRRLLSDLVGQQNPVTGAWGYTSAQDAVEPTCLASMAIRSVQRKRGTLAARWLAHQQTASGGWNAFVGHDENTCWTTSLAVISLIRERPTNAGLPRAIRWLIKTRGREASWLWRWKFQTVDTNARFNPRKYGWSWVEGTTSWVIPTALTIIALQKAVRSGLCQDGECRGRIQLGCEMLLNRMCPGGGWNAGNGVAFGVALQPHIDATAIALLALLHYPAAAAIEPSLRWLGAHAVQCPSPFSLAWAVLAMDVYRDLIPDIKARVMAATERLIQLLETGIGVGETCTQALAALAIEAATGGENVFEVEL